MSAPALHRPASPQCATAAAVTYTSAGIGLRSFQVIAIGLSPECNDRAWSTEKSNRVTARAWQALSLAALKFGDSLLQLLPLPVPSPSFSGGDGADRRIG